jgi:hypothetical protein
LKKKHVLLCELLGRNHEDAVMSSSLEGNARFKTIRKATMWARKAKSSEDNRMDDGMNKRNKMLPDEGCGIKMMYLLLFQIINSFRM